MQNRCFATTSWLRVLASILLWASGAGVARANTVDIIVERLDRGPTTVLPADVVAGRFDADFVAERYAALLPDTKHDVWYRLRLAGNWTSGLPAVLSIFDPQGLFVTVYQPPDYKEMNYNIYDSGAGSGFTRHALEVLFPPALTVAQPIYLRVSPAQPVPRSLEVDDVLEARRVDLQRARMDVVFPAVQLATLLVMLSFFLALRERVYAFFVEIGRAHV